MKTNIKLFLILLFLHTSFANTFAGDHPPINIKYSSYSVSSDGLVLGYYGLQRRVEVKSINEISPYVKQCLLATEDRDFYSHSGVSIKALGRAIWQSIQGHKQGGSTITMQLARNLFLTSEKTLSRKFNEINIAMELEKSYSKDQLLLMYLNTVYFGHSVYGIWSASYEYFSKSPEKLNTAESAMIIGLLKSPSNYDPVKYPDKALKRRNEVLHNLVETGNMSEKEFSKISKTGLNLKMREIMANHFSEYVRQQALALIKYSGKTLDADQLKITTTLDSKIQKASELAIQDEYKTFAKNLKDVQCGLVSIEPNTGYIKAMIGGSSISDSKGLNRSYQINRQLGSAFKPILYSWLLKNGYTLATPLDDSPIVVNQGTEYEWHPENYNKSYSNQKVTMQYAITKSLNLPAVHAMVELSSPDSIITYAKQIGYKSEIKPFPAIALGACETNPMNIASVFSVFASYGTFAQPVAILKIEDKWGNVLYNNQISRQVVLDSATCYETTYALSSVVDSGTGQVIRKYYHGPAAGKTGTTSDNTDAWYIGYTPELTTAIWFGFDIPSKKFGNTNFNGGTITAPVWGRMMANIQKSIGKNYVKPFNIPSNIEFKKLCIDTGLPIEQSSSCTQFEILPVNKSIIEFKTNQK